MFLILPVQSLLLYTTVGVSSYTLISWLLSMHPIEMMCYATLISAITSMGCVLLLFSLVPSVQSIESIETQLNQLELSKKEPLYCTHCGKTFGIQSDKTYDTQHRVVVEQDGTLIITTTFTPEENESESESESESVEEIRERLEKEEPLPSPVEETNEFAELLKPLDTQK
jgi:hypothetical protein